MNGTWKFLLAAIILIVTIIASVVLYIWIAGADMNTWFERWMLIAAITFLLGVGVTFAGLLIERGIRERNYDYDD